MGYNTQKLLTDIDGRPIPQYYDPVTDKFYPAGTMPVQLNGRKAKLLRFWDAGTVAAGATVSDTMVIDVSDYAALTIGLELTAVFSRTASLRWCTDAGTYIGWLSDVVTGTGANVVSARVPTQSTKVVLQFKNGDTVDRTAKLHLFGFVE